MRYRIEIDKPARKFIEKQPGPRREQMLKAIAGLPDNGDVSPVTGSPGVFRLRVGPYRIIYTIKEDRLLVLTAGNRGDVYGRGI